METTIDFITTKRTVCTVASFMTGTAILPALALAVAGAGMNDPVKVTLTAESAITIRQVMGAQPEGLVAKVNKELDELLLSVLMADPARYQDLLALLQQEEIRRGVMREQTAQAGLDACEKVLALMNLNRKD